MNAPYVKFVYEHHCSHHTGFASLLSWPGIRDILGSDIIHATLCGGLQ